MAADEDSGIAVTEAQGTQERVDPAQGSCGAAFATEPKSKVAPDDRRIGEGMPDGGKRIDCGVAVGVQEPQNFAGGQVRSGSLLGSTATRCADETADASRRGAGAIVAAPIGYDDFNRIVEALQRAEKPRERDLFIQCGDDNGNAQS